MPGLGVALEPGVFAKKGQINFAYRAVTLFAYDDFGNSLVLCLRVVDFIPVNEKNQVRILFDGARLPQIRHDRALVRALLQAAVQLG